MSDKELMESDEIINARIEGAEMVFDRGFILSAWLSLDYGGSGQGFGGYALGGDPFTESAVNKHGQQANLAADFIAHVMSVAEVDKWSSLKGKVIRVRRGEGWNGELKGIGHPVKNMWYYPSAAMKELTKNDAA